MDPASSSGTSHDLTPEESAEVLGRAGGHVGRYVQFQAELAEAISPQEARSANRRFKAVLATFVASIAGVLVVPYVLGAPVVSGAAFFWDNNAAVLLSLVLVSGLGVPYAGRVLFVCDALVMSTDFMFVLMIVPERYYIAQSGLLLLRILFAFGVGALVDYGASTSPYRAHPRRRATMLIILGLAWQGYEVATAFGIERYLHSNTAMTESFAPAILVLWGVRLVVRPDVMPRSLTPDGFVVYAGAWRRWRAHAGGRGMAVLAVALMAALVLHALDLREELDVLDRGAALTIETSAGPRLVWWRMEGQLLRRDLFGRPDASVFVLDESELPEDGPQETTLYPRLSFRTISARRASQLRDVMAPWRVEDRETFEQEVSHLTSTMQVWLLDQRPGGFPMGSDSMEVLEPLHETTGLVDESELRASIDGFSTVLVGVIVFSLLGFWVLWERGGDSLRALWVGLGLVAAAGVFALDLIVFTYEGLFRAIWRIGGTSSGYIVGMGLDVLFIATVAAPVLLLLGVLPWGIFVRLSAPDDRAATRFVWLKSLLVGGLVGGVLVGWRGPDGIELALPVIAVMILGSSLWRRRSSGLGTWRPSPTGLVLALGASVPWLYFVTTDKDPVPVVGMPLSIIVGTVVFGILMGRAILRDRFLKVASTGSLSYLGAAIVLPVLFEVVSGATQELTQNLGIASEHGAGIIGVAAVVLFVQPTLQGLERILTRVVNPGLWRARRFAVALLDGATADRPTAELQRQVREFLETFGVERFAIFRRSANNRMVLALSSVPGAAREVQVSEELQRYLVGLSGTLDLAEVPYEWRHYFYQFELYRLRRALSARYLLPVALGGSLRGFVSTADDVPEGRLMTRSFTAAVNDVAVVTTQSAGD